VVVVGMDGYLKICNIFSSEKGNKNYMYVPTIRTEELDLSLGLLPLKK
jgi:uncharacterized protein YcgL (UPF0745 family)